MIDSVRSTTRQKILDAAGNLFASNGFRGTSLRAIIREAGVNTASVHYHFGSKEGLMAAVVERLTAPINRERIERLDRLEADHPTGKLPLGAVVEALIAPLFLGADRGGAWAPRLLGRVDYERDAIDPAVRTAAFGEVDGRFTRAFARALPHLPAAELRRRIHLAIGAVSYTRTVPAGTDAECLESLIPFVTAGLAAACPREMQEGSS